MHSTVLNKSATGSTDSIQQITNISEQNDESFKHLKIQGCIDIVRKRYKVCYIDFFFNMSLSKINKSVITIRKGHFMNSVFVNPGIYSCAVDAFLEISNLFLPIYQIYESEMSLQTCFSMFVHTICLREKTVHFEQNSRACLVVHH